LLLVGARSDRDLAGPPDPDPAATSRLDVYALLRRQPAAAPLARVASADPADGLALPRAYAGAPADPKLAALPPADMEIGAREAAEACATDACVDQYLFVVYQRAPKIDTIRVPERIKVKVTKKVKKRTITKTVTRTITRLVDEDFTWKDPKAADRVGLSLPDYVIGGMDRSFKLRLYQALRALDASGLAPGITSGFRDDYRQSIAAGKKAATDSSYHGGSRRGGYGHGFAADLVSVRGATRAERWVSTEALWKWIDDHGKEFGVGRPYLDRDPPHVTPIDSKEYVEHRGGGVEHVASHATKRHHVAARSDKKRHHVAARSDKHGGKRAKTAKVTKLTRA
jgi:hypothetical protein